MLLTLNDVLERRPPAFDRRVKYGPRAEHFAELRFPEGRGPFPLLLMIHGGFWRAIYDLNHASHLCADLATRNIVTCNLEYRRVGNEGGGWPGTFQDISLAADRIFETLSQDPQVDMARAAVMGHSAGGHLALWVAGRHRVMKGSPVYSGRKSPIKNAISLGGVSDLRMAWKQHLGNGVVSRLMGGSPAQFPDRYDAGSPIELLPNRAKHVLVHGAADNIVPISQSEGFVKKAKELGENPTFVRLDDIGHFELIDPESAVWGIVAQTILNMLEVK
jgi:acetyl esterase/lipase